LVARQREETSAARTAEYRFFGLDFRVDQLLPGFSPAQTSPHNKWSRVSVTLGESVPVLMGVTAWHLRHRSPSVGADNRPDVVIEESSDGEWLRVRYDDGTTFLLNHAGLEVHATWTPPSTLEDVCTYLLGPVAGLLLYLRGLTCLHASAIAHGGRALVFVGAAEAGKSTLAAAFARRGHKVLSDDVLAIERNEATIVARPGLPRVGLWPPSVKQLWGHADALPLQVPTWDKRYLDLGQSGLFQDSMLPVGAVYVLADRKPGASHRIEPLVGTNGILALIANKYVTRISERNQDRRDFILLSALAASVPMRRITRDDALTELNSTCEAILSDYASLALEQA
jgi:hypothetical protein